VASANVRVVGNVVVESVSNACEIGRKIFASEAALRMHVVRMHRVVKSVSYTYEMCSKTFNSKNALMLHDTHAHNVSKSRDGVIRAVISSEQPFRQPRSQQSVSRAKQRVVDAPAAGAVLSTQVICNGAKIVEMFTLTFQITKGAQSGS